MSNTTYWMVPINMDALHLAEEMSAPGPMANFTQQPWTDGQRDFHSGTPYTSEEMLEPPFADHAFQLKAGIHLHWSLPDTLGRTMIAPDGTTVYPPVPDRWLIQRTATGLATAQWIVESTYLYPDGTSVPGAITMPRAAPAAGLPPYQYMGRSMPLKAWSLTGNEQYAATVTAVGYGEPTFAAFYPNCHSVFGFHDVEMAGNLPADLKYTVIGLYQQPTTDYFHQVMQDFRSRQPSATLQEQLAFIQDYFQWTTDDALPSVAWTQMMCYGVLNFYPDGTSGPDLAALGQEAVLAMGNTGTEALSAWLGQSISPDFKTLLEDQLEAVQVMNYLSAKELDIDDVFYEARHSNSFTASSSGVLWQISSSSPNSGFADAQSSEDASQVTLPLPLAEQLNLLNLLQHKYDAAAWMVVTLKRDLFADWYKYQTASNPPQEGISSYPAGDEVRWYMGNYRMQQLSSLMGDTGRITFQYDDQGNVTGATTESGPGSLAGSLVMALNALTNAVGQLNQEPPTVTAGVTFRLTGTGAPRWWSPRDPSLLVTGDIAVATERHGIDGLWNSEGWLPCHTLTLSGDVITVSGGIKVINPALITAVNGWTQGTPETEPGITFWVSQPWNPFLLEWEVNLQPVLDGSNFEGTTGQYDEDFITSNYDLPMNSPELVPVRAHTLTALAHLTYTGRSILTAGPGDFSSERILSALNQDVMPDYYAMNPSVTPSEDYLMSTANTLAVMTWYEQLWFTQSTTPEEKAEDPDYTLLQAWNVLLSSNFLSQSLDGFTLGIIQRKNTMQLPIADPCGFPQDKTFAAEVAALVGDQNTLAPLPLNAFSPLRSGHLQISRLRIVDNFGRFADLNPNAVIPSEPLTPPSNPPTYEMTVQPSNQVYLSPRFAQPARLNLRWLSAMDDTQEMNSHPATSPLCGWVVPNLWERSLLFYNADGGAIGAISAKCEWVPAPGSEDAIYYRPNIEDPHLLRVIDWLLDQGQDFFTAFCEAIGTGAENVAPETYVTHSSISLLMGQPLAIARVSVKLQLRGNRAVNQSWDALRLDLNRPFRDSDMFEYVKVPVRIGEYQQLNDGVIGFWIEEGTSFEGDTFYAPQSEAVDNDQIITHDEGSEFTVDISPTDGPKLLTVIFDPRGVLHATCGMLPVKEIGVPSDQYMNALNRIEVSFLIAPLLSDTTQLFVAVPPAPGFTWSWVERTRQDWNQSTNLVQPRTDAVFPAYQQLQEGWLKMTHTPTQEQ